MRGLAVALASALFVAGCSQADREGDPAAEGFGTPEIAPTAAPGVAFIYSYAFELADDAIAAVQEKHAARCEAMGTGRCRITGLNFSVNDDNAVSASLTVKLAPDIARQFGKAATTDVQSADGKLRRTQFEGTDTEPVTSQAGRQQGDLQKRIADVQKQLAATSNDNERAQLQAQLENLRSQMAQSQATVAAAEARLASTPMTFEYYGRGGIEGFKVNPVREAGRLFVASLVTMIDVVLRVLAILVPWLVLGGLILLILRSAWGQRFIRYLRGDRGYVEDAE